MLSWFQTSSDVNALIARKSYGKAIRILEKQLEKEPRSVPVRQLLADVLGRVGKSAQAVEILRPLVDEFAAEGFVAKAIAVLKKIQRLDPEQSDIDRRLAALLEERETGDSQLPLIEVHLMQPMEEEPQEEKDQGRPPFPTSQIVLAKDWFEQAAGEREDFHWSPLFSDFSKDELAAVIGGLRLLVKMPGAIIFAAGEPGNSFFVLASGYVRVYRRNDMGLHIQVTVLQQGEFFGEASVLEGSRRTATVTAAARCELLELDKQTFDRIAAKYPRVRERMEQLHQQRVVSGLEAGPGAAGDG